MNRLGRARGTWLLVAAALAATTCKAPLNNSGVRCRTDDDCAPFGNHPSCVNSTCVPSGLQPDMCFFVDPPKAIPMAQADFLNACGPDTCLSFSTPFDSGAMLRTPPPAAAPVVAPTASPTSTCKDLVPPGKQVLYISGSSDFAALLQALAPVAVNTINIVPVLRATSSCTGARSMNPQSPTYAADHYIQDPTSSTDTFAQIFLGDGTPPVSCLLGAGAVVVDLGESEIAQETCGGPANPPDLVGEALGPIVPIVFAVPKLSKQKTISAAAARQVFGGGGGVPPWEDPAFLFIRGQETATLRLVAKEIGLLPDQFWGTDQGSGWSMTRDLALLTSPTDADPALGMLSTADYDQPLSRNALKALGFQAPGQSCAYLPDSSLTSLDKRNVRDGHYPLWGRIHFFAARSNGMLTSPATAAFMSLFASPVLDPAILSAIIKSGMVPPCAMKVRRVSDLGDFTYFDPPPVACACAFEAQVGVEPSRPECTPCTSNSDCPQNRPSCRYGYCEQESE